MMLDSKKKRTKHSPASVPTTPRSTIDSLPEGVIDSNTLSYLSPKERRKLSIASPGLFRSSIYLSELLSAVAMGDPGAVVHMVRRTDPGRLFEKGDVTDACGQTFHDVSPVQLMLFLFDWDMFNQIKPLISSEYREIAHQQCIEMLGGGADLVKVGHDPRTVPFIELTRYIEEDEAYSLLENKDGIIFWDNQFFYANQDTQSVTLLTPVVSENEEGRLSTLRASLHDMENNSARRTNTVEHEFFARITGHRLERHGICYERQGVHWQDIRNELPLINAYRHYIRLYDEHLIGVPWDHIEEAWITSVGQAQRVLPVHILQRLCEENQFFYPSPTVDDLSMAPFKRTLHMYNGVTRRRECLLPFAVDSGLGFSFSIYRQRVGGVWRCVGGAAGMVAAGWPCFDLATVRRIEEAGKVHVAEFIREFDPTLSASLGHRSGSKID